jgi:hypothetical protein
MKRIAAFSLTLALCAGATAAHAETIKLKTSLDGATEVPAVTTEGKGMAEVALDTATKKLTYTVTYSGLSGPAKAAHIHGPAAAGANAGVVAPLTVGPSPMTGEVTLTDAQIADLVAGKDYINIHTADHGSGEIRGWLMK